MKTKNLFFMTFIVLFGVIYESSVQAAGIILNTVYLQSPLSSVNAINSAHVGQFAREITDVVPGNFATNIAARRFHAPVIENSAYKNPYYATLKMMEDQVSSTSDPIEMAEVIYKIIQNKNPKCIIE